jgi:hypothetical protein
MARLLEIWSAALQWFINRLDVPHYGSDDEEF